MLVFQLNLDHLEERCTERVGRDLKWLVELVAEINLYLPDDWRMTRSNNNFRIQVVGKDTPALVGRSYRVHGDIGEEILHIIDSVFEKGFPDQFDLIATTGKTRGSFDAGTKCLHPECIIPNLYFFRACPDDSPTPLFARQYEKVFRGKDGKPIGAQYHRIHPLTKAGLDLQHQRWVKWNITGHVEPVDTPDPGYRGKDYWDTPLLGNDPNRAGYEQYMINYRRAVRKYNVILPKPPEMPTSPYEHEYKFLIEGNEQHSLETFNLIQLEAESEGTFLKETGFRLREESEKRSREQVDTYFDDKHLTLYNSGVSFRLRKRKDVMRVTLKKRFPVSEELARHAGLYERMEEEAIITEAQKKALLEGRQINVFPYRLIAYVAPQCRSIRPKLKVINRRQVMILEDDVRRKVEMCLDEVTYEPIRKEGEVVLPPCFEIELESKGAPRESVERLARHLEKDLGLKPSPETKYQRGISLLREHGLFT